MKLATQRRVGTQYRAEGNFDFGPAKAAAEANKRGINVRHGDQNQLMSNAMVVKVDESAAIRATARF